MSLKNREDLQAINVLADDSYKDLLTNNNNVYVSEQDVQDVLNMTLNITGALFSFLGFPGVGIISMYQKLMNFLWPSKNNLAWEKMMKAVEELVDKKIDAAVKNMALSNLEGLYQNMSSYQRALEDWLENSNKERELLVLTRFKAIDQLFINSMPSFAAQGFEVLLLDVYAQAANLHLLLLRDCEMYGAQWGMPQNEIDLIYSEQKQFMETYTEHCVNWYKKGLAQLNNSSAKDWIKYNRFRREMTINVLDFVALFPSYDVRTYHIPTSTELTRIVYADPIGYDQNDSGGSHTSSQRAWYEYGLSFSEIENTAIPSPSLTRWFKYLKVSTDRLSASPFSATYWSGHDVETVTYRDISSKTTYDTYLFENKDIYQTESTVSTFTSSADKASHLPLSKVVFHTIDNQNSLKSIVYDKPFSMFRVQIKDSKTEIPIKSLQPSDYGDCSQYSHRLSYISNAPLKQYTGSFKNHGFIPVFGWMHTSVCRENEICPEKITQIPAVKGYALENSKVISGPGYTGGDIVELYNDSSIKIKVKGM